MSRVKNRPSRKPKAVVAMPPTELVIDAGALFCEMCGQRVESLVEINGTDKDGGASELNLCMPCFRRALPIFRKQGLLP